MPNLKVEMQAGSLVKSASCIIIQVDLGKNQIYVLLSVEGNKYLYQESTLSKER